MDPSSGAGSCPPLAFSAKASYGNPPPRVLWIRIRFGSESFWPKQSFLAVPGEKNQLKIVFKLKQLIFSPNKCTLYMGFADLRVKVMF
jgi:hypothetical protein